MDDQIVINQLKGLIIDGVEKANSGHPGGAMSSLDFCYTLFHKVLRFDPDNPKWEGRDRFILSAGHESMLLYSMLYMNGWLEMDEIKKFRQLHSKTPGHPENYLTPGVECTTGPLGQGAAMSVGFAIASSHMTTKHESYENKTYSILGDGCMQEDITLGAASLAGHLALKNLFWYYDCNKIQISGDIKRSCSDDYESIFKGFGWHVERVDGHDRNAIEKALKNPSTEKPTLLIGDTKIAHGSATMEGSHKTHGAPLPHDERVATKKALGIEGLEFEITEDALNHYRSCFDGKRDQVGSWKQSSGTRESYKPGKYVDLSWNSALATRNAFGEVLEQWAKVDLTIIGGSADLEPSNMTGAFAKLVGDYQKESPEGRNINFGVREFPMAAIANGIALYDQSLTPFTATFLSFADYSRAAIRLGAIQKVRVIHEFTHDSFYLGEDGPTHQAVEQVMSLRLIPNVYVMRPCDAYETQTLFKIAKEKKDSQVAFSLSRQKLDIVAKDRDRGIEKGAYIIRDDGGAEFVIYASGSEVSLALAVAESIGKTRVISIPCWELFFDQDKSYQNSIYDWTIKKRISIEAGSTLGWQKFVGNDGLTIGLDHFGDSAPAGDLAKEYGFTKDKIVQKIKEHF